MRTFVSSSLVGSPTKPLDIGVQPVDSWFLQMDACRTFNLLSESVMFITLPIPNSLWIGFLLITGVAVPDRVPKGLGIRSSGHGLEAGLVKV